MGRDMKVSIKSARLIAFSLILLLLSVVSCQKQEESRQKTAAGKAVPVVHRGGVYRVPLLNNPTTLDPAYVQDEYGAVVVQQLFDGLVRFSPELYVVPSLAKTWRVEDGGRTYDFTLRDGVRFHHGRSVRAEDVVFSLSRLLRLKPAPYILPQLMKIKGAREYRDGKTASVEGFEMVNRDRLRIHLDEPYAPFLAALGMFQTKIVPRDLVVKDEKAFGTHPIGTGPFRLVSWRPNVEIHLNKFADYFEGRPLLDGIVFRIYPGGKADQVLGDFLAGKLHEMPVYGKIRDKLRGRTDLKRLHRPSLSLLFYGFNCRHPLLGQRSVRRALAAAIDRKELVKKVYGGQFEPARTILPPGMPGYQPPREGVLSHGEESLPGLSKHRHHPVSIEVVSAVQSPQAKAEIAFIADSWKRLGVEVKPKFIPDWGNFENYLASDMVQVYRYVWFADIPHPDNFLYPLFGSDSLTNFTKYHNEAVDKLLGDARTVIDPVETAKVYHRIEGKILADMPIAPLFYLSIDRVYKLEVKGVTLSALGFAASDYRKVYLEATGSGN